MAKKDKAQVIPISRAKALRDTLKTLHAPETQALIKKGAAGEFRKVVAPVLERLLCAKRAPEGFRNNLIELLEQIYTAHHLHSGPTALRKPAK